MESQMRVFLFVYARSESIDVHETSSFEAFVSACGFTEFSQARTAGSTRFLTHLGVFHLQCLCENRAENGKCRVKEMGFPSFAETPWLFRCLFFSSRYPSTLTLRKQSLKMVPNPCCDASAAVAALSSAAAWPLRRHDAEKEARFRVYRRCDSERML